MRSEKVNAKEYRERLKKWSYDTLKLKSKVNVTEATPITVSDSGIIVTDNNGNLKLLSKETLE